MIRQTIDQESWDKPCSDASLIHVVATSLIIYPDDGHASHDPAHIADEQRRVTGWFDRYLKGG